MAKTNRPDEAMMNYGETAQTMEQVLDSKRRYRKVVQAAIGQWVRDFQGGKIKVETVEDLRNLIELDLRLQRGGR